VFIELVDALRCVRAHEPTWLVASTFRMVARDIVHGILGCPACGTRYPIEDGVADFRVGEPGVPAVLEQAVDADALALRTAALLDLAEPGGLVVLTGTWAGAAEALGRLVEGFHILCLDPPRGVESGGGISIALTAGTVPLRPATARGIALDHAHAASTYLAAAAQALRPGARLLAPVDAPIPAGVSEIARDAQHWLGIRDRPAGPFLQLSVAR
jgi:uncharacterized protein YbaR (Trm112 family)